MIEEKDETIGQVSQDLASYRLRFISVLKEHNLKSTQLNRLKNDIEKALENVNDISIEEPNAPELNTSLDASTQVDLPHAELSPMESEVHIPDTAAEYNISESENPESIEEQPDTRLESALIMDSENTESSQNVLNQPSESYPDSSLSSNNESENTESVQNVLNQPTNPAVTMNLSLQTHLMIHLSALTWNLRTLYLTSHQTILVIHLSAVTMNLIIPSQIKIILTRQQRILTFFLSTVQNQQMLKMVKSATLKKR